MILRKPVAQRRRHQERLLTITIDEVLWHAGNPTGPPGQNPLRDSHRGGQVSVSNGIDNRAPPMSLNASAAWPGESHKPNAGRDEGDEDRGWWRGGAAPKASIPPRRNYTIKPRD
jgi:hypothetical protein